MLKLLGAIAVLAALASGCGSSDPAPSAAREQTATATATATASPEAEAEHRFEAGHSRAVREYYGHDAAAHDNIEAEYHQPPTPATGTIGDTITLTGTNIGVRVRVTLTGLVDPAIASRPPRAGTRYVGVNLRLRSTGITILEDELDNARLTYAPRRRARPVRGVKAVCSHGFNRPVRIDVSRRARGCLLFEVPAGKQPRQFQLALEQVPAEAGGRWRL